MSVDDAILQIADQLQREHSGTIGVDAKYLPSGESVRFNQDSVFPTASVIKVAIVCELFVKASRAEISLDDRIRVRVEDIVAGSGVLCNLTPGIEISLRDLAMLTISVSDNTASNLCLRAVGGPVKVNGSLSQLWGAQHTVIHRPIKFDLGPDDPPYTATGIPSDMCLLLRKLHAGEIGDRVTSDAVLSLMKKVHDSDLIPRYLPVNPYATELNEQQPGFVVAHKTGASSGVRNDVALISRGQETLAICIYSRGVKDDRWTSENAGSRAVAELARIVINHFFD